MVRTCWVAVRLCIGIDCSPLVCLAVLLQSPPPIMQPVVTFFETVVAAYHRVKKIFSMIAFFVDELHGSLAFLYL